MKNSVCYLLYSIFILLTSLQIKAQDIHFSQFSEASLLRNPSLAGLFSGDVRIQSIYRTQWQSVTVPYQTVSLSGEYKFAVRKSEDFMTIGGQILYDKAGSSALSVTHVLPVLNYHKSLNDQKNTYLSLGFMGGLVQRRLDRSKLTTNSQFDGTVYNENLSTGETFSQNSFTYFDGTAGLSFNTELGDHTDDNMYIGIAYHHFNSSTKNSFYGNDNITVVPKWVVSGGIRLSTAENSFITVEGDYKKQGKFTELIGGLIYSIKLDDMDQPKYLFHGGLIVRWKDAVIPVAKLEIKPLTFSISYDANISKTSSLTNGQGGFELGISYQKFTNKDNSSREAVLCPRF